MIHAHPCFNCVYLNQDDLLTCKAFPKQIPDDILNCKIEHDRIIKGQVGAYVRTHDPRLDEEDE